MTIPCYNIIHRNPDKNKRKCHILDNNTDHKHIRKQPISKIFVCGFHLTITTNPEEIKRLKKVNKIIIDSILTTIEFDINT